MKMNFKLKALAAAAILVTSAPAFASMQNSTSGNGELIVNFISQGGTSATLGGDDYSAAFDLGVSMNDVLSWNGVAGFSRTWNLDTGVMSGTGVAGGSVSIGTYSTVWSDLNSAIGVVPAAIQFNVIALDSTDKTAIAGGSRYLTTADVATYPSLTNVNQLGFSNMDAYVDANNLLGTHVSSANGASLGVVGASSYFRSIGGGGQGDTWMGKTTADTTTILATAQNFWSLVSTAPGGTAQASKTAFGVDLNANSAIGAGEYGEWSVNAANHTITYTNPGVAAPVPEASTWAMLVAGLGMISMMIRRRTNS
jgi:hypothetical protein